MKIVFILDVKLIEKDNNYYTTGATDYNYFSNKININDQMTIICRKTNTENIENLHIANGKRINIIGVKKFNEIKKEDVLKLISEADYIILKMPTIMGKIIFKKIIEMKKRLIVEMVGCPWDALWNHSIKGKILAPYMYLKTKKIIRNSPNVIYVTNKFLQKRYPTKGNNIGCSDVMLENLNNDILANRIKKIKNKDKKTVLGTIAAMDVKYKGQQYVMKAIAYLKREGYNFEYQLIGGGNKEKLEKLAKKLSIEKNIKIIGSKPHNEIFEWLDNIDIYIQPSNTEGLCRSLIEAMSRACPCIVSNAGGNPELIEENVFKKKNIKDLKNEILKIAKKENLIKSAQKNFEKVKEYEKEKLDKKRSTFFKKMMI